MIINEKIPFTIMMSGTIVEISRCVYAHLETRMHYSTMHTAASAAISTVRDVCLWVQGVSAYWSRGCLPLGLGCLPLGAGGVYHTPFTRMNQRQVLKHYFPAISFAGGNKSKQTPLVQQISLVACRHRLKEKLFIVYKTKTTDED